jgi:CheY-like chemotaxis protein
MQQPAIDQNVIIADNDSMIRGLLRSVLNQPGRALYFAVNGIEAVEFAQQMDAALVLLDMRMPQLDGLDACVRIRQIPRYRDIPIAILTAFDSDIARRKAQRLRATAFLVKPFTTNGILRSLEPLIEDGVRVVRRKLLG